MADERNIEVTVTIITYMHEKYIRRCLDSVFAQKTNFAFQVVVAEDCSPDNTRSILLEYKERYGDQLVLILQEKNLGPGKNSRSLTPYIKGKYSASVEGDDYWTDPYKLQKQYEILEKNPQYSGVCSDYMIVDTDNNVLRAKKLNLEKDITKSMNDWFRDGLTLHICTNFKRTCIFPYDDKKYIDLRSSIVTMGDSVSFALQYDYGDIYVMHEVTAAHRVAGESDTSSFGYLQKKESIKYLKIFNNNMRNLEKYFGGKYDFSPRICHRTAVVKCAHLLGQYKYKNREMLKIQKDYTWRMNVSVYYRMVKIFWGKLMRRLEKQFG